jgi:hypothetical protein
MKFYLESLGKPLCLRGIKPAFSRHEDTRTKKSREQNLGCSLLKQTFYSAPFYREFLVRKKKNDEIHKISCVVPDDCFLWFL